MRIEILNHSHPSSLIYELLSNWLIGATDPEAWRWMLGIVAVPSLVFVVLILSVPESPRWLVLKKNATAEALATLKIINADGLSIAFCLENDAGDKRCIFRRFRKKISKIIR